MKRMFSISITVVALLAIVFPTTIANASTQLTPYFYITEVVKDKTVTITTYNFPANDTFQVTMGAYGTLGIGGIVIGTTDSGSGGTFTVTYDIPSSLANSLRIAIRLQSPTSGYFAYNWFWNNTATVPSTTPIPGYRGFPTFSIVEVVRNESVTILTNNMPPDDTFTVRLGKYGTLGIGGIVVASTQSGEGGSFEVIYTIPSELVDMERIAIRLESPTTGYFAYNWFWNFTTTVTPTATPTPTETPTTTPTPTQTPTATPTPSGYHGFPTFSITAVVKDESVTIDGVNFPANDTFTVLMGKYGTYGIGGIEVVTTNTDTGGVLTATYAIPASLAGQTRIAIRLQSPTSGYFAYNWFWNNTTTDP
jgi:hypothetical protein